jgi:hypothetical protein
MRKRYLELRQEGIKLMSELPDFQADAGEQRFDQAVELEMFRLMCFKITMGPTVAAESLLDFLRQQRADFETYQAERLQDYAE